MHFSDEDIQTKRNLISNLYSCFGNYFILSIVILLCNACLRVCIKVIEWLNGSKMSNFFRFSCSAHILFFMIISLKNDYNSAGPVISVNFCLRLKIRSNQISHMLGLRANVSLVYSIHIFFSCFISRLKELLPYNQSPDMGVSHLLEDLCLVKLLLGDTKNPI